MMKSLAVIGLVVMTSACASAPEMSEAGPPPQTGPQVFISPFGEPYQSQPGEPYPVAAWFKTVDTDADGKISQVEFTADGQRFFTALDANEDGVIGTGEIAAYEAMTSRLFADSGLRGPGGRGPGGGRRGGPPSGGGLGFAGSGQEDDGIGNPPMEAPRRGRDTGGAYSGPRGGAVESSTLAMAGLLNVPEPVKAADTDTNQRVTPQEWTEVGNRWFRLLDTNRDGFLTLAELPQTGIQRGGGRRGPPH